MSVSRTMGEGRMMTWSKHVGGQRTTCECVWGKTWLWDENRYSWL